MQRYKGYIFYFPGEKKMYLTDSWKDAKEKRIGCDRIYEGVNSKADVINWIDRNGIKLDDVSEFVINKEEKKNG